jgi:hypothetical protein
MENQEEAEECVQQVHSNVYLSQMQLLCRRLLLPKNAKQELQM